MSKNKPDTRYQIPDTKFLGQSLIEVVIAMAVIVGLAVALVTTTLVVQKASRTAKNNTQATKLVQQNIEQVRIFRDRNPLGFAAFSTSGCVILDTSDSDPSKWTLGSDDCPSGKKIPLSNVDFYRKISVGIDPDDPSNSNPTKRLITVTVTWTDSGGTQ